MNLFDPSSECTKNLDTFIHEEVDHRN